MENEYIEGSVRTRLILAGITEIEEHGIRDFSLRRVALTAQVSCAAPYRHFRDKNELVSEIIKYIGSRWNMLYRQIEALYEKDTRRLIIEASVAMLRFWLANPNFRSVLTLAASDAEGCLLNFDSEILDLVDRLYEDIEAAKFKRYALSSLIYGTLMLIGIGVLQNNIETISLFRRKIEDEIAG